MIKIELRDNNSSALITNPSRPASSTSSCRDAASEASCRRPPCERAAGLRSSECSHFNKLPSNTPFRHAQAHRGWPARQHPDSKAWKRCASARAMPSATPPTDRPPHVFVDHPHRQLHRPSSTDNGRGIPASDRREDGRQGEPKRSAAEIALTELHAGGKFNQNSYSRSAACGRRELRERTWSKWLRLTVRREGKACTSSSSARACRPDRVLEMHDGFWRFRR